MTPDRKRALERIQKCLNLAKSSEPHEAAAALRQAQKLMEMHGVSEDDVNNLDIESEKVVSADLWRKSLSLYLTNLVHLIEKAFGVKAVFEPSLENGKYKVAVRYFGTNGRAQLAAYTHAVIWRTLKAQWNAYSKTNPWVNDQKGARTGFWIGWIQAVKRTVMEFGGAKEEEVPRADGRGTELVPTAFGKEMAKIEKGISSHYGGDLNDMSANSIKTYSDTRAAGAEAAQDFSLHRPMEGGAQKQLTKH